MPSSGAFYTADELVELLLRNVDSDGWLQPLLDDPDSAVVFIAMTEIMSRASKVVDDACNTGSISLAPGATPGNSTVLLEREVSGTSGTIPAGYRFVTALGVEAVTQADVVVAAGAVSLSLNVTTSRMSEAVNTEEDPGFQVSLGSPVVMDDTDTFVLIAPVGSVGLVSTSFSAVTSSDPIRHATSDWLVLHGTERGVRRQPGESTGEYRLRVRNIPDAVSPIAIAQAVLAIAQRDQLGDVQTLEPFGDGADPLIKAFYNLGEFETMFLDNDFLDDPEVELVSKREARAYIRIEIPISAVAFLSAGLFYGEIGDPVPFGFYDDIVLGYYGGDTTIPQQTRLVSAALTIWEEVDRKRAGGVQFDVFLDNTRHDAYGEGANTGSPVWTITAPGTTEWFYVDGLASAVAIPGPWDETLFFFYVKFTFSDATTFQTPSFTDPWSQPLSIQRLAALGFPPEKRITKIEGFVDSGTSVSTVGLAGAFWLLDATA